MKPCYAVQHGGELTVFKHRLEAAVAYQQICPGSVLVYKAHGNWGGQAKRSTRWLRVPFAIAMNNLTPEQVAQAMERLPADALEWAVKFEALSHPSLGQISGEVVQTEAAPAGGKE